MNKHVTVNGPLENPKLSQQSHVDNHLFPMSQICGGLGGKKDLPLVTPKDKLVRKIVVLAFFFSWHQSILRETWAIMWHSFFLPVIVVADTQHLFCTFKIHIHSGRPDKKAAEDSSHPADSDSTFIGTVWTSNLQIISGYGGKEEIFLHPVVGCTLHCFNHQGGSCSACTPGSPDPLHHKMFLLLHPEKF